MVVRRPRPRGRRARRHARRRRLPPLGPPALLRRQRRHAVLGADISRSLRRRTSMRVMDRVVVAIARPGRAAAPRRRAGGGGAAPGARADAPAVRPGPAGVPARRCERSPSACSGSRRGPQPAAPAPRRAVRAAAGGADQPLPSAMDLARPRQPFALYGERRRASSSSTSASRATSSPTSPSATSTRPTPAPSPAARTASSRARSS